ncbi:MAG TPA: cellulase family glycosylhydrolase [Chloroflexota bacterium]|nr:cellulase family glycosylhydrolase [Chloroflexota bacterium]
MKSPTYAVHTFLWGNSPTTARDLRLAREAGFMAIKQRFEWRYIEGQRQGLYEWNEPDRIVKAAEDAGLAIIARIDNQPSWARRDNLFPGSGPPDDLDDWRIFLERVAARYKGRITAYQIWNEPNLDREWANREPSAEEYVSLLRVAYQAIKKSDPDALVISAGLSPTTEVSSRARADAVFLPEMYAAGLKDVSDMVGVHGAGFKAEPEADPAVVSQSPDLTNNDPSSPELRRLYAFRHVEDIRQIMIDHGDATKQMAILEMGWTSDPRPASPYAWHSVSEETKGEYIVRAFQLAAERWRTWMGFMTVIYLPEVHWTRNDEQYWWSLTDTDGSPRPAYSAIKRFLRP